MRNRYNDEEGYVFAHISLFLLVENYRVVGILFLLIIREINGGVKLWL